MIGHEMFYQLWWPNLCWIWTEIVKYLIRRFLSLLWSGAVCGGNIMEGTIEEDVVIQCSYAWSTSQQQQLYPVTSGKCWFVFICIIIWKLCYQIACSDHFWKKNCLYPNNFYCKIRPNQKSAWVFEFLEFFLL